MRNVLASDLASIPARLRRTWSFSTRGPASGRLAVPGSYVQFPPASRRPGADGNHTDTSLGRSVLTAGRGWIAADEPSDEEAMP